MNLLTKITQETVKVQERIKEPDHPVWRKIGNWCVIVGSPLGTVLIETFVPDPWKKVALVAFNSLMAGIKLGSKLTKDKAILHTNNTKTWKNSELKP
jgi:hypothetical protein